MSEKHTSGPWKFGKELSSHAGEWLISMDVGLNRGNPIAEIRPGTGDESANARLISSAPDLLEALRDARRLIELVVPFEGDVTRKIDKAISKATGQAS